MRWTTAVGIAVGGAAGAVAALTRAPPPVTDPTPPSDSSASLHAASAALEAAPSARALPVIASTPPQPPSARPPPPAPATGSPTPGFLPPPALRAPLTRAALSKAMLLCDQQRDFDQCERAALAFEGGTTGPTDAQQAKRFRRIALTHLVAACEDASPHACFVLAAKFRAGTEVGPNAETAVTLEQRGLELCRLGRRGSECAAP
jgi:hypothetical protein